MKTEAILRRLDRLASITAWRVPACVSFLLLAAGGALAQSITTNAFDSAADPAYANDGAPNGLSPGGQNGGFGFGPWNFTVNSSGGAFIQTSGPSGDSFDLWNNSFEADTFALRPFDSPLSAGQSFSVQLRLNNLDGTANTNMLAFEDASGNILFSYFHLGGDNLNGHYTDATTNNGVAVNFHYDYQSFDSFTFTLNGSTNYLFSDNTTGASFSGAIAVGPITQVAFIRGNGQETPGNGQDFQFDDLQITAPVGTAPPIFANVAPAPGAFSVATNTALSLQIIPGSSGLRSNNVTLTVDGIAVSPIISNGNGGSLEVSYQPPSSFPPGTAHAVQVVAVDTNNTGYTNAWSFTTAFASLPAVLPGPISTSNQVDVIVFSPNDSWIGTNYDANSSKTLYASFWMEFNSTNDTSASATWGGLDFYQGDTEKLLVGKNGGSLNWSVAVSAANGGDVPPYIMVEPNDWHHFVVRLDYSPGADATANIWLDPDMTQPEVSQSTPPLTLTLDNTFDNIRLRCGFSDAMDTFTNVVISQTSPFAKGGPATFQGYQPSQNDVAAPIDSPIGLEIVLGSYNISTNDITLNLDGTNVPARFVVSTNSITVSYQPPAPFAPGSYHVATVNATDSNGTPYSTSWSFTVDEYPSLPQIQAGPFDAYSGQDVILYTAQNEWIDGHYGANSTNTLYTRFSMTFFDLNGETGQGGGFGGLEFYMGDTERLLTGNNWISTNWSTGGAGAANGQLPNADIPPVTAIVLGEWHTMLIKCVYAGTNDAVQVWLDPDFTKSENDQPNPPLSFNMNNTFDNIHLRAGNGTAQAEYTNIVFAPTAQGVGLPPVAAPSTLSLEKVSGALQLSWTGGGTLQSAPAVTGPWTTAANQSNPQSIAATNSALFFRLQQ